MNITEVKTREQAREQAIDWQTWQAEQALSYGELIEWQDHFKQLAERWDLIEEFKENGLITSDGIECDQCGYDQYITSNSSGDYSCDNCGYTSQDEEEEDY